MGRDPMRTPLSQADVTSVGLTLILTEHFTGFGKKGLEAEAFLPIPILKE
jgi:hypothetical protein